MAENFYGHNGFGLIYDLGFGEYQVSWYQPLFEWMAILGQKN